MAACYAAVVPVLEIPSGILADRWSRRGVLVLGNLGALGGGLLAAVTSPRMTYFATLPMLALSTVALLAFREPTLHEHAAAVSLRRHVADTVASVRTRPQLLPIVGLLVSTSLLTQAVYEFGPLWLLALDAGTGFYGIAWAMLMASLGIGGALAGRLRTDTSGGRALIAAVLASSAAPASRSS
jgi:hypothetical protein